MIQRIREKVFETNSSSIHALCVYKDYDPGNFDNLELEIEPIKEYELDDVMNHLDFMISKIRYLWTIRCLFDRSAIKPGDDWNSNLDYNPWEEREWVDEFTSMLRSIFPKCSFIETDNMVDYLEDYEYLKDDPKMLDETFIRKLVEAGSIDFTSRDGNYSNWQYEKYIDDLRKLKQESKCSDSKIDVVWSEG